MLCCVVLCSLCVMCGGVGLCERVAGGYSIENIVTATLMLSSKGFCCLCSCGFFPLPYCIRPTKPKGFALFLFFFFFFAFAFLSFVSLRQTQNVKGHHNKANVRAKIYNDALFWERFKRLFLHASMVRCCCCC